MYLSLSLLVFLGFKNIKTEDFPIKLIQEKLNLSQEDLNERGRRELKRFVDSQVWKGGYYEGDPTDPQGNSSYSMHMKYKENMFNPLYICYLECLKPFINSNIDVLEIGPGKGAWSKAILSLNPRSLTCIDALSAEHNQFWDFVGNHNRVTYFQVKDFLLNEVKDDSIDFVFSFGTFCHISSLMCYEYFKNLFKKLRSGAQGFIMYADLDKKNAFAIAHNKPDHAYEKFDAYTELEFFKKQQDSNDFSPTWSTWYHLGIERAQIMFQELGYEIINKDININERDPVIHFRKS